MIHVGTLNKLVARCDIFPEKFNRLALFPAAMEKDSWTLLHQLRPLKTKSSKINYKYNKFQNVTVEFSMY